MTGFSRHLTGKIQVQSLWVYQTYICVCLEGKYTVYNIFGPAEYFTTHVVELEGTDFSDAVFRCGVIRHRIFIFACGVPCSHLRHTITQRDWTRIFPVK